MSIFGVTDELISDGTAGAVVSAGIIRDVTTSYGVGSTLYVSKTGGLTDQAPAIGVDGFLAGDFIVRVGVLVANPDTPSQKDFVVNINIVGQL